MGSATDLQREIVEARGAIESKIVRLRDQGTVAVRQVSRQAALAAGIGAAIGVAAIGVYLAFRLTRPATRRERIRRVVPSWLPLDLDDLRAGLAQAFGSRMPPVRLYIGDKMVGEDPPAPRWEKIAIRIATAAATAGAGVLAKRVLAGLRPGSARA
jgi:hypothetical protein